ncbi:phage terminase small subunit P27 family [Helicovermis profundi]|uniref:Phage terminase small subunit P27 family n=1 Tax=Helicovermis profundi TaxID=3065157 RepID=A0AAU9EUP5_9FIRM|nr:hypothetical protein HLPR_11360 [Clostridia bacterium S502]
MSIESIIAAGNKAHLTKAEIKNRKKQEEELNKLKSDKIKAPSWLGKDAKNIFKKIVKELDVIGLLCNVDVHGLTVLSDSIEKFKFCTIALHGEDLSIEYTNKAGFANMIENPMVKTQLKYAEMIKKYSADFGLSPVARLKIVQQSMPDIDDDELEFEGMFNNV